MARVQIRAWQVAYRGLVPDEYLDSLNVEDRAGWYDFTGTDVSKPYRILNSIADTMIARFVTTMPSRLADLPQDGEVAALYVSPEYWDRKIGAALIAAGRERLVSQGFASAYLWLLDDNHRVERLYRLDGWWADGAKQTDTSRVFALNELRPAPVGSIGVMKTLAFTYQTR